jgi:hypothetical protein
VAAYSGTSVKTSMESTISSVPTATPSFTAWPCPGQEPSAIVPQSEGTFVAVAGKTHYQSAECASATIDGPIKKHIIDHFDKKPVPLKPKPKPKPEYHPPTPTYGGSTPM